VVALPAHRVRAEADRSFGLPAPYYTDPGIFALERERIFAKGWAFAGLASSFVEGATADVRLADDGVVAVARRAGRLEARCDGRPVAVEDVGGLVLVNRDPAAAALRARLGDLARELGRWVPDLHRLRFAARITSEFAANWKVMVDNSIECYHCPVAHPDFDGLLDLASYRVRVHDIHAVHEGRAGRPDNTAYAFADPGHYDFASFWLWPNLLFGPFPGRCNLTVHQIVPLAPERTREHFDFYFLDAVPNAEEAAAVAFFRDVLRPQDVALCESVQRGLHSLGYRDGRLVVDPEGSYLTESNLHRFHRLVVAALGAGEAP
jgi:choline monooxygenase